MTNQESFHFDMDPHSADMIFHHASIYIQIMECNINFNPDFLGMIKMINSF